MNSLCPSPHFFTKRNDREKVTSSEKREEINISISQHVQFSKTAYFSDQKISNT